MGAHCSAHSVGAAAVAASACHKACESTHVVQILDCTRDDKVDEEVFANCKLLRSAADGCLEGICDALAQGAEMETRTSKYVMLPVKSWGEEAANSDVLLPTSSGWQDPPVSMRFGLTPVMMAAKEGRHRAVKLLLDQKACPNTEDEDGMRPLHFAAEAGSLECCKALIASGAAPAAQDDAGRDAFSCVPAESLRAPRDRSAWVALLRPSGADAGAGGEGSGGSPGGGRGGCATDASSPSPKRGGGAADAKSPNSSGSAAGASLGEVKSQRVPQPLTSAEPPGQQAKEPSKRQAPTVEWDPFLGTTPGQDGM